MANMTDYLEVEVRKHIFRTGSFTKPAALYVGLWTDAATIVDASTGSTANEATGGSYARAQLDPLDANWTGASATDGLTDNAGDLAFTTATASWGTIRYAMVCDASTAGNALVWVQLDADKVVGSGDTFKFAAGAFNVTFA